MLSASGNMNSEVPSEILISEIFKMARQPNQPTEEKDAVNLKFL